MQSKDQAAKPSPDEHATRSEILRLVQRQGPISAVQLASALALSGAGIRRHLGWLETRGLIVERQLPVKNRGRGRPARLFVATEAAHQQLGASSHALAVDLLGYLGNLIGPGATEGFAEHRAGDLAQRYVASVEGAGIDPKNRAEALVAALNNDGFAASLRPGPGGTTLQLCQGHCPIQPVAAAYPEMCEAETKAFAGLLGVHVQRLATLAGGHHVCTTTVPLAAGLPLRPKPEQGAK